MKTLLFLICCCTAALLRAQSSVPLLFDTTDEEAAPPGNGPVGVEMANLRRIRLEGAGAKMLTNGATGDNRVLVVTTCSYGAGSVSSVIYSNVTTTGTQNLTADGDFEFFNAAGRTQMFHLVAPASGANNVVMVYWAGGVDDGSIHAWSCTNANQSTPIGTVMSYVGGSTSRPGVTNDVASAVNDMVIDHATVYNSLATFTAGAGQTSDTSAANVTSQVTGVSSHKAGAASATTMSWVSSAGQAYTHTGVAVKAR